MPGKVTQIAASSSPTSIPSSRASVATTASSSPLAQPRLDLAPLLRRVAAAVGGDPRRQLRLAAALEVFAGEALDQLDPAPAFEEADRPHPLGDQLGQQVGRLRERRAARARAPRRAAAGSTSPPRARPAAPRRRRSARTASRPAARPARPGWRSSPRRAGSAAPSRRRAPPAAAAAARWRRGSRRRRGRCGPRRPPPTRGWRGSRPSACGGAGGRRGACPGW